MLASVTVTNTVPLPVLPPVSVATTSRVNSEFVIEGTGMGHIVTVVSATDADAGVNGVIGFQITGI